MYRVTVMQNVDRKVFIVEGSTSVRQLLEMADLTDSTQTPVISGYTIDDLDVTLEELGVAESCTLSMTKRLNNAR